MRSRSPQTRFQRRAPARKSLEAYTVDTIAGMPSVQYVLCISIWLADYSGKLDIITA